MSASISKICRRCATGRGPMPEDILCLNAGSSSLKFALYRMGEKKEELLTSGEMRADSTRESSEHRATVRQAFADLEKRGFPAPAAVGHRLVHGGPAYAAPQRIDAEMLAALRQGIPLAPLHLPSALEVIEAGTHPHPHPPPGPGFDTAVPPRRAGVASDMKPFLARREPDPGAAGAGEMFCASVRKSPGALAAVLGGVQTLVFTGGIGERAAPVRWEICQGLEHLGIRLDPRRNADDAGTISTPPSACTVRVIPTNEDLMIARHTRAVLRAASAR